jgi:hypothetical protein
MAQNDPHLLGNIHNHLQSPHLECDLDLSVLLVSKDISKVMDLFFNEVTKGRLPS